MILCCLNGREAVVYANSLCKLDDHTVSINQNRRGTVFFVQ